MAWHVSSCNLLLPRRPSLPSISMWKVIYLCCWTNMWAGGSTWPQICGPASTVRDATYPSEHSESIFWWLLKLVVPCWWHWSHLYLLLLTWIIFWCLRSNQALLSQCNLSSNMLVLPGGQEPPWARDYGNSPRPGWEVADLTLSCTRQVMCEISTNLLAVEGNFTHTSIPKYLHPSSQ